MFYNTILLFFPFLSIVDKYYSTCIYKNFTAGCCVFNRFKRISNGSNHSIDYLSDSCMYWCIDSSSNVKNCRKKQLEWCWNCSILLSESSIRCYFRPLLRNASTMSHKGFWYTNVQTKYSSYILSVSLRYHLSTSLSLCGNPKQYGGFFYVISGIDALIGRPEHGESLVIEWPHLSSINHQQVLVLDRTHGP